VIFTEESAEYEMGLNLGVNIVHAAIVNTVNCCKFSKKKI
jgi:hypothetical protein